ncbi:MAG: glycosyltransferase family 2 protein [Rhizobiales bacterium]|nr:glycosyltransferase family 2 protein [Hyphomicrobiales bacterium]
MLVPAFDAAATLSETLASILAQKTPVAEIIVIDDGSSDATAAIAAATPGVRLVRQSNAGTAAAFNAGLEIVSGNILAFLDADDLWAPDTVGIHLANLARRADADGSIGWVEEFVCPTLSAADAKRFQPRPPQLGWLSGATFVRLESFRRVGRFDNATRGWPWIGWAHRAKLAGLVFATVDKVLLRRRLHPTSLSMREGHRGGINLVGAARQALQLHRAAGKID